MDIQQRLQEDMKTAMKAGEKERLQVIRMLLSDVKVIDMAPKPTTAEDVVAAYAKKLRKSIDEYTKLGKPDAVEKLKFEVGVAESYLPKKASPEETAALVDAFLASHSFTEKQIGQAMGAFLKTHSNVEPATVNSLLRQRLAGK